jgi:hypothetical protein
MKTEHPLNKALYIPQMRKMRWVLGFICVTCVCLPFVLVEIPPILDLAQQTAQIRLFRESVSGPESPYRIQWFTPNKLSYGVLGLSWLCAGPAHAGRLAMIFFALLWVVSCFWLAARRNRPVSMAALGCVFFFNHFVYLGFLSFAVGFPVFVVWFVLMCDPPSPSESTRKLFLVALGGSVLLYAAHALWLAAGAAWLVLHALSNRHPRQTILIRILGISPLVLLAGIQDIVVAQAYWGNKIALSIPTLKQLFSSFYLNYAFGGVRGWLEPLTAAILLVWVISAVWQYRKDLRSVVDRPLFIVAIFFIVIGLLLPSMVGRTLFFGSRWVPVGCALFLIAMPSIRIRGFLKTGLAVAVVVLFCVATTKVWIGFERHEMAGFPEAMEQIPPGSHLIALDFQRVSPGIKRGRSQLVIRGLSHQPGCIQRQT